MKNKLFILLLVIAAGIRSINAQTSGSCGNYLSWSFQNNSLNITGVGAMYDYASEEEVPWYTLREDISHISFNIFASNPSFKIGARAFCGCSNLISISLPNNTEMIGDSAFCGCTKMESIVLPNSLETLGQAVFSGCSSLKAINLPDGLMGIPNSLFFSCSSLSSISFPSNVSVIGVRAFANCINLHSVNLPASLVNIYPYAFSGCNHLEQLYIPQNVFSIGLEAFSGCGRLASIVVAEENLYYDSRDSCNAIINKTELSLVRGCVNTTIPYGVTHIGSNAFSGCEDLSSIDIPGSVTHIDNAAFDGCINLSSVNIPSSVTNIGWLAFRGCQSLTSIFIPESVAEIGDNFLYNCGGLSSISVSDLNTKYHSRNNCNAIVDVDKKTLIAGCKNSTIPNDVETIGDYAFFGCHDLVEITIPDGVTTIKRGAFEKCYSLLTISMGKNMNIIESLAFKGCNLLDTITCYGLTPPSVVIDANDSSFSTNLSPNMVVRVPTASISLYSQHEFWGNFDVRGMNESSDIKRIDSKELTIELLNSPNTRLYTLQGCELKSTNSLIPRGVYIIKNGNQVVTIYVQ